MRGVRVLLGTVAALVLLVGLTAPPAAADPIDEKAIFIEINDTDGDAGIQVFLDAEGWEKMQLLDPDGNILFDLDVTGSMQMQGITELFFESAEPSFDEQPLADFLALFPEGTYRFRGRTNEGVPLRGKAELTHNIPGAPILVSPGEGEVVDPDDTVVEWLPVADPPGSEIIGYQVIVEREDPLRVFRADVGPETTSVTVPPEFMAGEGTEFKFEVLAIEESGNQTISEREFETEGDDEEDDE